MLTPNANNLYIRYIYISGKIIKSHRIKINKFGDQEKVAEHCSLTFKECFETVRRFPDAPDYVHPLVYFPLEPLEEANGLQLSTRTLIYRKAVIGNF